MSNRKHFWNVALNLKQMSVVTKIKTESLNKQFINAISDEEIITEIIVELTAIKETNKVTSEQVQVLC